jgi:hypothetical protein
VDCDEDWIRLPAEDADVHARIAALAARAARHGLGEPAGSALFERRKSPFCRAR